MQRVESEAREKRTEEVASPVRPEDNTAGSGRERRRSVILSPQETYETDPWRKGRVGRPTVGRPSRNGLRGAKYRLGKEYYLLERIDLQWVAPIQ